MSRIPRDIVDTVRERTDIAEVIGRHVRLERRGNSLLGLCPFHQERTPSFNVVPQKGMYYCFGCQAGGDVFRFLMQVEGLSFVEAVRELAQAAGVEIPERDLTVDEQRSLRERATLYDVLDAAAGFYESILWTRPEGEDGRAYLEGRGLNRETAQKARVGFAPPERDALLRHLGKHGYPTSLLVDAGLVKVRQSGDGHYDAFRARVLFPIRDERSRVIAFGGRLLEGDGPKYLNTPETRLYQKSQTLYGLELARQAIQQRERVLLVEGYFDVLSLHQAGFGEAVASCGTSLTPEHLDKLRRITKDVVVLLDADEAGSRAAEKALPMFLAAGLQPWRIQIPGAKDPDELIREEGPGAMERAMAMREPLLDWVIDRRLDAEAHTAVGRQRVLDELLPWLSELSPSALSGAIERISARLRVPEASVHDRLRALRLSAPAPDRQAAEATPLAPAWRSSREDNHVLWLLVHQRDEVARFIEQADLSWFDARIRPVIARLVGGEPVASIFQETLDAEVRRTLQAVVARPDLYTVDQAALGLCEILGRLTEPAREARLGELKRAIDAALKDGDTATHRVAARERSELLALKNELRRCLNQRDVDGFIARLVVRPLPLTESSPGL